MNQKRFLSAQSLLQDAYELAARILESGFKPTFMIAVWRGGVPIGIAVQEYLAVHGIETDNIAIRSSSYDNGIDRKKNSVRVDGLNYLIKNIQHTDRLLIVDDVFDTGRSIDAIITQLKQATRLNMPEEIRVAVPFYKPDRNKTSRIPDYYLHKTEAWLKFPHSIEGLNKEELAQERPELFSIIRQYLD